MFYVTLAHELVLATAASSADGRHLILIRRGPAQLRQNNLLILRIRLTGHVRSRGVETGVSVNPQGSACRQLPASRRDPIRYLDPDVKPAGLSLGYNRP
jgi:hypothetical protein